ncbi:hypothetical protein FF2_044827 [Malus domestica]
MMGFPLVALGALKRNHCLLFKATDGTAGLHRGRVKKGIKKEPKAAFAAGENTRGQRGQREAAKLQCQRGETVRSRRYKGAVLGEKQEEKGGAAFGQLAETQGTG